MPLLDSRIFENWVQAAAVLYGAMTSFDVPATHWYIGMTDDPRRRQQEHRAIDEHFLCVQTRTEDVARAAKAWLVEHLGTLSEPKGGISKSTYVYAVLLDNTTEPTLRIALFKELARQVMRLKRVPLQGPDFESMAEEFQKIMESRQR